MDREQMTGEKMIIKFVFITMEAAGDKDIVFMFVCVSMKKCKKNKNQNENALEKPTIYELWRTGVVSVVVYCS